MSNNFFTICSFFYSVMLVIIYFKRENSSVLETKIYSGLVLTNLFNVSMAILCYYTIAMKDVLPLLNNIVGKTLLILFITWEILFTIYVFVITRKYDEEKIRKKIRIFKPYLLISYAIVVITIYMLPLFYHNTDKIIYSFGPSANFVYVLTAILIIYWVALILKNYNILKSKKCIPIILFIVLTLIVVVIQKNNPGLLLITATETFITVIMYFTIENPDVKMNAILLRNKELVEKSVNDKSNFLFKVSQEMKKPILNIMQISKNYDGSLNKQDTKNIIEQIETNAKNAYFIINDISSVSSMDVKKIKTEYNKYSTDKLLVEVKMNVKNQLFLFKKDKDIEFNLNINNEVPKYLYGDNIKLKQVLLSIVNNSINYTKTGFIDIEVDSIVRYDVCRVIFSIKDSGCGMPLSLVNELMSSNDEIDISEFQKIDSLNLKIPVILKVIKLLGGNINIKSDEGKGTNVVVVIDQKIENTDIQNIRNFSKYNTSIKKKKRVLIADDSENLEKIERITSKLDVEVVTTLIGKDVVDKINSGNLFDLIILKDEMKPDSAYSILKELKKNNKFKTPVVIMINKDKEFIKDHFISDGFSDCVILDYINQDLKKVLEKYI